MITNQKLADAIKLSESFRLENESLTKQLMQNQDLIEIETKRMENEIIQIKYKVVVYFKLKGNIIFYLKKKKTNVFKA